MDVLGQKEALPVCNLEINQWHGFVAIDMDGPDGIAHVTLTPDQARSMATQLTELANSASEWD